MSALEGQPDLRALSHVGAVAIGRNEGERLRACLQPLVGRVRRVVYVDSGSTDGSVDLARELGAEVVNLDLAQPFTAARARNAGFARLIAIEPAIEFVQFVDGDCEVVNGWLRTAAAALGADSELAVVCGRRRERHPEASIYNALCDIEWDTPIGPAKACGGDAMIRVAAFREVNGYNPAIIAGEEPEMCVRLRVRGWTIQRLDAEMTLHDAAMMRFGQWWRRNVRAGHAYGEGAAMYGSPPVRHWMREVRSNYILGFMLPLIAVALAWPTRGASLLLFGGYALVAWRVYRGARRRGLSGRLARLYAVFIVLGKVPQALGQLKFLFNHLTGRRSQIIEYKGEGTHVTSAADSAGAQPVGRGGGT